MKNINTYLNEQLNNRILENLNVYKDNHDPILKLVPKKWFEADDRICLHFSNISALLMYALELEGEIMDGKYANTRPDDHWEWTKKTILLLMEMSSIQVHHHIEYQIRNIMLMD